MKPKNYISGLIVSLVLFCVAGMVNASVLTFEDSEYANSGGDFWTSSFQTEYGGLSWSNMFGIYYGPGMNTNYQDGVFSDNYAVFNEHGDAVEVTITSGSFDWNGAWFSSARLTGSINVSGYFGGTEIYTDTIGLVGDTSAWFQADWSGVDRVRFHGIYETETTRFQMDDFTINEPIPTPEPATMFLFGSGLAALAGYRLRKERE